MLKFFDIHIDINKGFLENMILVLIDLFTLGSNTLGFVLYPTDGRMYPRIREEAVLRLQEETET